MSIATLLAGQVVRQGSQGEAVRQIQLALAKLGYKLSGTGYFGGATDTAVEDFQRRAGVSPVDGVVGNKTARAIDLALGAGSAAPAAVPTVPSPIEAERPLWLLAGLKFLGTKESSGSADNAEIMKWAKEEGGDIAKAYTHDVIPWCALFANMMLTKAGLKGTETLWALDFAGKWPSVKLDGPAVGAFAPMLRDGGGHIICITGRDQNGNVMGLGGNQSDKVSIIPFPMSRLNKGFWWPAGQPLPAQVGIKSLPLVKSDGKVSTKES